MEIKGNTFLVTGGASGLGEGTARLLAEHGAHVIIADLQVEKGEALAQEIGAVFVRCDVTKAEDADAAVQAAKGKLRGLINCAGIASADRTINKTGPHNLDTFTRTIMINLVGSFNMIRVAAHAMSQLDPLPTSERGVMISTASAEFARIESWSAKRGSVTSSGRPMCSQNVGQ